jgi:hypothetical protein
MAERNLIPGQYSAVHLRALYGNRDSRDPQEMVELAALGVNCASNLLPGAPIYFASDTKFAVDSALKYADMHQLPVVSITDNLGGDNTTVTADPIHLDKDDEWESRDASAYDSTFIDLYMLAQSRCVTWSNGGYGTFGSLLSYDSECQMRFFKQNKKVKNCAWMSADRKRHNLDVPHATTTYRLGGDDRLKMNFKKEFHVDGGEWGTDTKFIAYFPTKDELEQYATTTTKIVESLSDIKKKYGADEDGNSDDYKRVLKDQYMPLVQNAIDIYGAGMIPFNIQYECNKVQKLLKMPVQKWPPRNPVY